MEIGFLLTFETGDEMRREFGAATAKPRNAIQPIDCETDCTYAQLSQGLHGNPFSIFEAARCKWRYEPLMQKAPTGY
jgi:hypothetical protein